MMCNVAQVIIVRLTWTAVQQPNASLLFSFAGACQELCSRSRCRSSNGLSWQSSNSSSIGQMCRVPRVAQQ
jgi:hypothetical protein